MPEEIGSDTPEARFITQLWPHLRGSYRFHAQTCLYVADYSGALAFCIEGCYRNGYRIPESVLQELETFNEVAMLRARKDGDSFDYLHIRESIARVRSLDTEPVLPFRLKGEEKMLRLPDDIGLDTVVGRSLTALWSHMSDGARTRTAERIAKREYDLALALCIEGCYASQYRIAESHLQGMEAYAADWPEGSMKRIMMSGYVAQMRSIDTHSSADTVFLPDEIWLDDECGSAIATLWPHIDDGDRSMAAGDIAAGEYDSALAACIQGCYLNGYRIPEDYLQELEEYADDCPDDPDCELMKRYIARVRSLDDHPVPD